MTEIEAVVFDMGGVLVELSSLADVLAGSGLSADEIWERWILSTAVRRFEGGQCDVDTFADDLIAELGVDLAPAELIERFLNFPQGLFEGAEALVADVAAAGRTTAVLSNTNALHWNGQPDHERIQVMFDREYTSFSMQMLKPDPEIYLAVIADLGLDPERIVFIDDNQVNVDGALAVGMAGAVAKGPVEARAALVQLGVLAS